MGSPSCGCRPIRTPGRALSAAPSDEGLISPTSTGKSSACIVLGMLRTDRCRFRDDLPGLEALSITFGQPRHPELFDARRTITISNPANTAACVFRPIGPGSQKS